MVLSIDPERERISLGIKQLAKDPFSAYIAENPKGTIVKGWSRKWMRAARSSTSATASRDSCAPRARPRPHRGCARVLKVGDEIEAKFTGVDRKSRTITLSIKAKEAHEEAEAVQSYRSECQTLAARAWATC